jgi:hypothetical protein
LSDFRVVSRKIQDSHIATMIVESATWQNLDAIHLFGNLSVFVTPGKYAQPGNWGPFPFAVASAFQASELFSHPPRE